MSVHPLLELWQLAARGQYLIADGGVTVVPPLARGLEASVAFTGHAVVATRLPAASVMRTCSAAA
jgi:hypothetical protein